MKYEQTYRTGVMLWLHYHIMNTPTQVQVGNFSDPSGVRVL
jgi:hypothetical protein